MENFKIILEKQKQVPILSWREFCLGQRRCAEIRGKTTYGRRMKLDIPNTKLAIKTYSKIRRTFHFNLHRFFYFETDQRCCSNVYEDDILFTQLVRVILNGKSFEEVVDTVSKYDSVYKHFGIYWVTELSANPTIELAAIPGRESSSSQFFNDLSRSISGKYFFQDVQIVM